MNMPNRILIIGASGAGTSTLGKLLAQELQIRHIDLDDLFWIKTDPPFTSFRSKEELKEKVEEEVFQFEEWIISGDPSSWKLDIEARLSRVYFLTCSTAERVRRLNEREKIRHGEDLLVGGKMHEIHRNFINWTKQYETGGVTGRTLEKQEKWLKSLSCPVHRIDTEAKPEDLLQDMLSYHN